MALIHRLAAAVLGTAALTGPAAAADLLTRPQAPQVRYQNQATTSDTYLAVRGGAAWSQDTDWSFAGSAVSSGFQQPGFMYAAAIGLHLDRTLGEAPGLRAEIEIGHKRSETESHTSALPALAGKAAGAVSATYAMASLYYDFFKNSLITPFVGAGAGIAQVSADGVGVAGGLALIDDHGTSWIYHATAGVSVRLSPRWQLEAAYRFMETPDVGLRDKSGASTEMNVRDHMVLGGIRANF
jgi:opacity protein-like surface antigen